MVIPDPIAIESADELKPFPTIALKLYESCQEKQPDVRKIISLIEAEPYFATEVLSLANSPIYGCARDVATIQQSMVILGLNCVTNLGISIASKSVFLEDNSDDLCKDLYLHSLLCAVISRHLATGNSVIDANTAFLTGLLHDVGKLVFVQRAPENFVAIKMECEAGNNDWIDAETSAFGICHQALGERYVSNMGLPVSIAAAVGNHHNEEYSDDLSEIVKLGNGLSKHWFRQLPPEAESLVNACADQFASFGITDPEAFEQEIAQEYDAMVDACCSSGAPKS